MVMEGPDTKQEKSIQANGKTVKNIIKLLTREKQIQLDSDDELCVLFKIIGNNKHRLISNIIAPELLKYFIVFEEFWVFMVKIR